jgi:hypothetical protein
MLVTRCPAGRGTRGAGPATAGPRRVWVNPTGSLLTVDAGWYAPLGRLPGGSGVPRQEPRIADLTAGRKDPRRPKPSRRYAVGPGLDTVQVRAQPAALFVICRGAVPDPSVPRSAVGERAAPWLHRCGRARKRSLGVRAGVWELRGVWTKQRRVVPPAWNAGDHRQATTS